MTLVRRSLFAFAAVVTLGLGGAPAWAAPDDMALGNAKAKVTVIEYASVTCPHCAHWQEETWPAFKKKWVDTGKVRFILRELPTPPEDAASAGFLIARCAGPKYFAVIEGLFAGQARMYETGDARAWLLNAAARGGLDEPKAQACLEDEAALAALNARVNANVAEFDVAGTPTFIVNGRKVEGATDLASLEAAMSGAKAKGRGPMTFLKGLFKKPKAH
jgi:protein-disulfide isomerase